MNLKGEALGELKSLKSNQITDIKHNKLIAEREEAKRKWEKTGSKKDYNNYIEISRLVDENKKGLDFARKAVNYKDKKYYNPDGSFIDSLYNKDKKEKYLSVVYPEDIPDTRTPNSSGGAVMVVTGTRGVDNSSIRKRNERLRDLYDFENMDLSIDEEKPKKTPKSPSPSPPEKQFSPKTVDLKLSLLSEKKADPEKDLGKDKTEWENKTKNEKASTVLGFLGASVADARAIADRFFGKDVPLDHLQKYNERLKASKQEREEKLREYLSSVENLNRSIKQYNAETQNNAQLALANRSLQQNATTKFTLSPQQEQEWWAKSGELAGQYLDNSGLEGNK